MQRGHIGNETELFIERGVYEAKDRVKGISTTNAEYSMIKSVLERTGLIRYGAGLSE